jgi:hypothetical protein
VLSLGIPLIAFTGLGLYGVEKVASQGPDLAGIALVITATSGLIATVGALILGLRKKPSDVSELALRYLLEQQAEHLNRPEDPA